MNILSDNDTIKGESCQASRNFFHIHLSTPANRKEAERKCAITVPSDRFEIVPGSVITVMFGKGKNVSMKLDF
jgi:hypothetical protein